MDKHKYLIRVVLLIIILPLIIWFFAVKKTYLLQKEYNQINGDIETLRKSTNNAKAPIRSYSIKDKIISNGKIIGIIENLSDDKINIVQYTPKAIELNKNKKLFITEVTIKGDFNSLLEIVYNLEMNDFDILLPQIFFYSENDESNGNQSLYMKLVIAQIE